MQGLFSIFYRLNNNDKVNSKVNISSNNIKSVVKNNAEIYNITDLPISILQKIMNMVAPADVISFCSINRRTRKMCEYNEYFENRYPNDFPVIPASDNTWTNSYINAVESSYDVSVYYKKDLITKLKGTNKLNGVTYANAIINSKIINDTDYMIISMSNFDVVSISVVENNKLGECTNQLNSLGFTQNFMNNIGITDNVRSSVRAIVINHNANISAIYIIPRQQSVCYILLLYSIFTYMGKVKHGNDGIHNLNTPFIQRLLYNQYYEKWAQLFRFVLHRGLLIFYTECLGYNRFTAHFKLLYILSNLLFLS